MIHFNKPNITKIDIKNLIKVCKSKFLTKTKFNSLTSNYLQKKINSKYISLTQSGSDALEVAFHLLNLKKNDEVIIPSYTFSSTANAIILANGKPVFADINSDDLCINLKKVEKLITKRTKAICLVHYGGNSCDMKHALYLKKKYNLKIIEDAAHALFSKYKNKYCGTIGDIGIFSFHETKNFTSAQGGAISINNKIFIKRCKDIINKGNSEKLTKENYYYWVDKGSEYEMSGISAALLLNQLKQSEKSQEIRKKIFNSYKNELIKNNYKNVLKFIDTNKFSKHSYHIFGIIFKTLRFKEKFIKFAKKKHIHVNSHYYPLHLSPMGKKYKKGDCKNTEQIYNKIVRLPIYASLTNQEVKSIINLLKSF